MKKILVGCCILVFFMTGIVFAECPNGQTEITIVNPAGKAIEMCAPEVAIPAIQGGAENSGGTVVSAVCPCFTQEDIENAADSYGVSCGRILLGFDSTGEVAAFHSAVHMGDGSIFFKTKLYTGGGFSGKPYYIDGVSSCLVDELNIEAICRTESTGGPISISTEEAFACQALLWATFDWVGPIIK